MFSVLGTKKVRVQARVRDRREKEAKACSGGSSSRRYYQRSSRSGMMWRKETEYVDGNSSIYCGCSYIKYTYKGGLGCESSGRTLTPKTLLGGLGFKSYKGGER
ncbi:hypothetical protein OROMI_002996 [Orobanche minor]